MLAPAASAHLSDSVGKDAQLEAAIAVILVEVN